MIVQRTKTQMWIGYCAMAIPIWFVCIYLAMAWLHPDFSHSTKAISELGAIRAPNRWVWNVFGYILPGIVVALLGWAMTYQFPGRRLRWVASLALIASGLLMALSGVFPGDFVDRDSFTMVMHAIGSFGSFLFFLIAGFSFPWLFHRTPGWNRYTLLSISLVILCIGSGFWRSGEAPGIGQRMGFAFFFLWIGVLGWALVGQDTVRADLEPRNESLEGAEIELSDS